MIDLTLHPERRRPSPEPLAVSLVPVAVVGIGVWIVALVVTTILWATDHAPALAVWTCAVGAALGAAALLWTRRHPTPPPPTPR